RPQPSAALVQDPARRSYAPLRTSSFALVYQRCGDAAIASDGSCPVVSPSVLVRKSRTPGGRGPHDVPPILSDGQF
ncbi:MAG: hypothetical protein OEW05_10130, partial [Candidatus Aminicenantes bacterium]|nr:hypothetical protein [Candidatus Aminicenantes bacterium]